MIPIKLTVWANYDTKIMIDAETFTFYGHISDYPYDSGKLDSYISFRLLDDSAVNVTVETLRANLKMRVDKNQYVKLQTTFEDYCTDKRPKITVRLSSGMRGIASPAQFEFAPTT